MSTNVRPGVYTSYEIAGSLYGGSKGRAVGLVANAEEGTVGEVVALTGYAQAQEAFGGGNLVKLAEILFRNGAPKVYAVRVEGTAYSTPTKKLMEYADIKFMVCDDRKAAGQMILADAIDKADERSKYRILVAESEYDTVSDTVETYQIFNNERVMAVTPYETDGVPGSVAAAVCGVMASCDDPALPLNGAELKGLGALKTNYSDSDLALLIGGGVSVVETLGGKKTIVRGVTTRTTTNEVEDYTWREVNTIMILDEVIPGIRDELKLKFSRAKNTAQTRGAIRTQVLVALEDYRKREIIDSYGEINVSQSEDDPTVCLVSFAFTVAHGLNQIELHAHITV